MFSPTQKQHWQTVATLVLILGGGISLEAVILCLLLSAVGIW